MQDLTGYFRGLTKDTCVSGLALVKGANPNYDVLVAAGTPLAEALASSFGVGGGEVEAFRELEAETEFRRETTAEELEGLVSAEDLESQAEMWKAR